MGISVQAIAPRAAQAPVESATDPAVERRGRPLARWLPGRSLQGKLLLLSLLLVVVPGAVFAGIAVVDARRALERAVGRQLAEVAHDAAERVEADAAALGADVTRWSALDAMRLVATGDRTGDLSRLLVSLAGGRPSPPALAATDRDAVVVAASDPAAIGTRWTAAASWQAVLRGRPAIAVLDRGHAGPALALASPILAPGDPPAVLGALVAISPLRDASSGLAHLQHDLAMLGLDVTVLLVDGSGRVVAGGWWREESELAGASLAAHGWRTPELARAQGRAAWAVEPAAGALVGHAAVTTADLGMVALAVQPLDEAIAPIAALRRRLRATLAVVLVAGLGLAAFIADRLGRPIRALTAATRELARHGELRTPVDVRSRDEIGDLALAFNRLAGDLAHARDDLVVAARFAFVGELAAGMAHEIRTPLGIVRSAAQMLGRGLPAGDTRSAELLEMIVSEVDRLERVVAGLLELARPREPALRSALLTPVLSRALDLLAMQASDRGIALRREFSVHERPARCDPDQIYQVVLNLVVNALQNVPRGGTVLVRTIARADRVGFEVADDGPGIPEELQQRIFAPFFTRRPGGTGLGLALVQRIVQAHRGAVSVQSAVGRGTTFRVELPTAEERA